MKYALIVLAALAALVLVIVAIGYSLPVKHRASRQIHLRQTPEKVFALINDPSAFPSWRSKVKKVEILPDQSGHRAFREIGGDGTILFEVDSVVPNKSLVTRIADKKLPFGGTWSYAVISDAQGTTLRITEDGEVYNPIFRFASRFVMGHSATIDGYLRDAAAHFGENTAEIEDAPVMISS